MDQSAIIAWKEELNMNESRSDFKKKENLEKGLAHPPCSGIMVVVGGLMWGAYNDVDSTMNAVFNAVDTEDKREDEVSFSKPNRYPLHCWESIVTETELKEMGATVLHHADVSDDNRSGI